MTKLKTRKALLKRIKVTGKKKILVRRVHQRTTSNAKRFK